MLLLEQQCSNQWEQKKGRAAEGGSSGWVGGGGAPYILLIHAFMAGL